MSDLAFLGLADAAELIRSRKLSPVELTQALLARIEKLDPRFHAFIKVTPDIALGDAKAAEAELASGKCRGPLHGVPFALKDIIDYAGLPTTAHSRVLIDNVAKTDAVVTERLKVAGGIMMGKLATHEFAIGGPSFDLPWPPAVNPWGGRHLPGGSSSGSGVALASGLVPAALGTDTGGSVRNPASMCAIVGLKPTYGLVSRRGVIPLSFSLDHVGPMTRNVRDNALLLQILAGHDPLDPGSVKVDLPDYTATLNRGIKGLRVGLVRHFYDGDVTADPEQIAALDKAAKTLRQLGADVREVRLASASEYETCCRIILASEAYAIHRTWLRDQPQNYGELGRQRLLAGAAFTAADYIDALRMRTRLTAQTLDVFKTIDVALTSSSLDPPCVLDDTETVSRIYPRQSRQPFNVTGQPALAMCAGFTKTGLPLSLQLIGRPFEEATVYQVAHAYEVAAGWTKQHPPGI